MFPARLSNSATDLHNKVCTDSILYRLGYWSTIARPIPRTVYIALLMVNLGVFMKVLLCTLLNETERSTGMTISYFVIGNIYLKPHKRVHNFLGQKLKAMFSSTASVESSIERPQCLT